MLVDPTPRCITCSKPIPIEYSYGFSFRCLCYNCEAKQLGYKDGEDYNDARWDGRDSKRKADEINKILVNESLDSSSL